MDIQESLKKIYEMSDVVLKELGPLSGIKFGFNRESIEWVDGFIERQRVRDDFNAGSLVNTLGSFLGERLVAQANGRWAWVEEQQTIGIKFREGGYAFPFNKVQKQLQNGREAGDSVVGFFDSIIVL